jgi:sterol desaturase/sphingolipid hydroxylase (fatty acid hydroxylase superfamily)
LNDAMPTPLHLLIDPISIAILSLYAGLLTWERLRPGRALPRVPGWTLRASLSFAGYFLLSSYVPLVVDPYLGRFRLVDLTGWGTLGGAAVGVLLYEALAYSWHRMMHTVPSLWRSFHQMHHSAERIEALGAFYFSPLDMVGWTLVGSIAMVLCVGITPAAAAAALLVISFLGMFQHANVRTPRWLGYLVQRPESHTVHHARGIHRCNYADLPIFDILFGTFENPARFEHQTGFYPGASARVVDMLAMRDVSTSARDEPRGLLIRPGS